MSPASDRPPEPVDPRPPKPKSVRSRPVKPWQRVEPGRYRSSDGRFTLESDGGGRWFVTDEAERDELGLARTTGPFATLDAARAAAEEARSRPAAISPLAARLSDAASRPRGARVGQVGETSPEPEPIPEVAPAPPPRTWLDDLADNDPEAARRARRLIQTLVDEAIADADTLVRRDVLGGEPAIARRLLGRAVLKAVASVDEPTSAALLEAVLGAASSSGYHDALPGWELVERAEPGIAPRSLRLTALDLERAAADLRRAAVDRERAADR